MSTPPLILVTGANGFIGSHLTEELLRRGRRVRVLVRPQADLRWLQGLPVEWCRGDVTHPETLPAAVQGCSIVYHLGAAIHAPDLAAFRRINTDGTHSLLACCREHAPGLQRFVFVSSISAAGPSTADRPKSENDPCVPVSDYGRSKLEAEEIIRREAGDLPWVIVRPPNVLGEREKEVDSMLRMVGMRLRPFMGNGDRQTSFCMVQDLVQALILAAEHAAALGQTYFVTDGNQYSWMEPVDILARLMGKHRLRLTLPYPILRAIALGCEIIAPRLGRKPPVTRGALYSVRHRYWTFDGGKIRRELGFTPTLSLEDGLRRIVEWHKRQNGRPI